MRLKTVRCVCVVMRVVGVSCVAWCVCCFFSFLTSVYSHLPVLLEAQPRADTVRPHDERGVFRNAVAEESLNRLIEVVDESI